MKRTSCDADHESFRASVREFLDREVTPYGFMTEYRVARPWRDARVTKIWAGSNDIMKELIGRDLGL